VPALGISAANRDLLTRLNRWTNGVFTVREAAGILPERDVNRVRRLLAYLAERGWLVRVSRGLYAPVPLDAQEPSEWRIDPWIIADRVFSPDYYIGGWSAAEYWDLTEQVFNEVMVMTARSFRSRVRVIQGHSYNLRSISKRQLFGIAYEWRDRVRVSVSDPTRTVVDVLDAPVVGGGIQHGVELLRAYLNEHRNDKLLVEYVDRIGNRTVAKRLGFLLETMDDRTPRLLRRLRRRISKGISLLDPSMPNEGPIVTRWNLRINASVA